MRCRQTAAPVAVLGIFGWFAVDFEYIYKYNLRYSEELIEAEAKDMGTHTDFQILFSGDAKTVKAACKYADSLLENEYKSGKNPINVYESYQYVWSDDLAKLAFQFIDEVPSLPFTIEAVIDASESAGEYQNVQFEYKDGRLLMRQSCWYLKMYDARSSD